MGTLVKEMEQTHMLTEKSGVEVLRSLGSDLMLSSKD